jgi:hypothetical protein
MIPVWPDGKCHCFTCEDARMIDMPYEERHFHMGRMFLCAKCGNKRCPHAKDHRNACTNSNEPGQKGSLYE